MQPGFILGALRPPPALRPPLLPLPPLLLTTQCWLVGRREERERRAAGRGGGLRVAALRRATRRVGH